MDHSDIVDMINTDPSIQKLITDPIHMRIGYTGLDGFPRCVPVSYLWNGKAFAFASPTWAYKVRALTAHPEVAFTVDTNTFWPLTMIVRGTASIEVRPGVPEEHIEASRRHIDPDQFDEWLRAKRESLTEMAVISIVPTHIRVMDWDTRFPPGYDEQILTP